MDHDNEFIIIVFPLTFDIFYQWTFFYNQHICDFVYGILYYLYVWFIFYIFWIVPSLINELLLSDIKIWYSFRRTTHETWLW